MMPGSRIVFRGFQRWPVWMVAIAGMLALTARATAKGADNPPTPSTTKSVEATAPAAGEMNLDQLKAKRAAVEGSKELGESVKGTILSFLDQAIRFHEQADRLMREAEEIAQKVRAAPDRLKKIQAELGRPMPSPDLVEGEAAGMETEEIEQRARQEEGDLANAKTALLAVTDALAKQKSRPQKLREDIAKAKDRLEKLREKLKVPDPPDEPSQVTEARRASMRAEQAQSQAEIKSYQQQLVGHDILVSLLTAERDLATRDVVRRETLAKAWLTIAQRRRQKEAMKAREGAQEAKRQAGDLHPGLREQFDFNIKIGAELEKLTQHEEQLTKSIERKQAQLKELEEEFALARERVETTVLTEAIGLALREQRRSLPTLQSYRKDSAKRQVKMSEIREVQFRIDRKRRELADVDAATDRVLESLVTLSDAQMHLVKGQIRTLLSDRRDLFEKLQAGYNRYFKNLQSLEFTERQIVTKAREYAEFLDGYLLWIRSSKIIGLADLRDIPAALGWIVSPTNLGKLMRDLEASFSWRPTLWVLGLIFGGILLAGRRWMRRDFGRVAKRMGHVERDSFALTLRGLGMTICLAASWPFLMGFVSKQLLALPIPEDYTRAVSSGLFAAAFLLVKIGFFSEMYRANGLARLHFKLGEAARVTLSRNLTWLLPLLVPLSFLLSTIETQNNPEYHDSLGRLAFMVGMVGVSVFAALVLRSSGGVVSTLVKRHRHGWRVRLRFFWYPLAVGVPLFLAVLSFLGYHYTAVAWERRLEATFWLIVGLIVVNALLLRLSSVAQRRLAFEEAKRKRDAEREAARSQKTARQAIESNIDEESIIIDETEVGLARIDEQTRALVRNITFFSGLLGLWAIWAKVFPALSFMDKIHLWSYSAVVDGMNKTLPITLSSLMLSIVVAVITIVSARNLPGVLEITLLRRLPMDSGVRYASITIIRYAITAIGFIVAFSTIGVSWSSLKWLIAALGVGLGFGLQEIVANFVCGLIVLFERPYRVGDVLTVADISGIVTRIRIRATTVTNWDRQELIVPNKEFITGRLINWSLSDQITRITVPVGIAYGSDTDQAEELMMKVARENPMVLDEPEPSAVFVGFGDSSLNFELRVFVGRLQDRVPTGHQLHQAIEREFRQAGIAISFPQRDVHLDVTSPLDVRLMMNQASLQRQTRKPNRRKRYHRNLGRPSGGPS